MRVKLLIVGLGMMACLQLGVAAASARVVDRIVASVNGDIITLSELNRKVDQFAEEAGATTPEQRDALKKEILDVMIMQKLTLQEGKRLGIEVSEKDIEETIERIMKSNNLTREQFEQKIREKGGTLEDFKEEMRGDILKQKILRWELAAFIVVKEDDIDAFLKSQGGSLPDSASNLPADSGPKIHIRHIFLGLPQDASEGVRLEKKALADKIYNELKQGLDFAQAAQKYSEAPNAQRGGDLGTMPVADIAGNIRSELVQLQPGQFTQPVSTGDSIQLFQVVERSDGKQPAAASPPAPAQSSENQSGGQVGSAQEREQARAILTQKQLEKKFEEWIEDLRKKAMIRVNL